MTLRVLASFALLALAPTGCAGGLCEFFEIGDPEPIEVEDFSPLPAGYELVSSEGGCGQGGRPIDCSRDAEISPPADTSIHVAVEQLRAHVEDLGWKACGNLEPVVGRCYSVDMPDLEAATVTFSFSHWRDDC